VSAHYVLGSDGLPQRIDITGNDYLKAPVDEHFAIENGSPDSRMNPRPFGSTMIIACSDFPANGLPSARRMGAEQRSSLCARSCRSRRTLYALS
jgi:hypothetical protein